VQRSHQAHLRSSSLEVLVAACAAVAQLPGHVGGLHLLPPRQDPRVVLRQRLEALLLSNARGSYDVYLQSPCKINPRRNQPVESISRNAD
jgi:hypothetical protein